MNAPYVKEITLSQAKSGSRVRILKITGGTTFKSKMISLGLMPNSIVEILNCDGCVGPMAVRINQTRVVIGRGMAEKIEVKEVSTE